jgi:hypothetical protein
VTRKPSAERRGEKYWDLASPAQWPGFLRSLPYMFNLNRRTQKSDHPVFGWKIMLMKLSTEIRI